MPDTVSSSQLDRLKLVAVIRMPSAELAVEAGRALLRGGITAAEITFTVPDAPAALETLAAEWPGRVGAGTVLSPEQGRAALAAGAAFLVSPALVPELVPLAHGAGALAVLGGLTPSEIVAARRAGADVVKVFPVFAMGGPSYIQSVLEPLPDTRLMVSGGVGRDQIATYYRLGVCSVAIGGALLPRELIQARDWAGLERHARAFVGEIG